MTRGFRSKRSRGFTLIELMIVVSLITITSSILLITYFSARATNRLQAAQREIAVTIKLAHSYALQGKVQGGEKKVPCGYGFHFVNKTTYEIFYNSDSDCVTYNKDSNNLKYINGTSEPAAGDSYTLIKEIETDHQKSDSVYFTVPHGGAFGFDGNKITGNAKYTIKNKSSSNVTATINIGPGGKITEDPGQ